MAAPAIGKLATTCDLATSTRTGRMNKNKQTALHDGIPMPQRVWAVMSVSVGAIISTLDGSIANVALPTIALDLHVSVASSVWVVNGFQLTVAVLVLAMSAVAEIVGLRRIYWIGLFIFTLASAACGLATSLPTLVAGRVGQGIGASCIFATYPGMIAHIYPRRMLGQGIGISAMIVSISSALGPTVSSAVLAVAPWPWLFYVNLPLGALGLVLGLYALPRTNPNPRPFDLPAALVSGAVIALGIIGLDGLGRAEDRLWAVAELVLAFVGGALLIRREGRRSMPLVPVDLLRIPVFGLSVGTSISSYAAQAAVLVSLPFLFQHTLGWSAVATGLVMTPIPLAVATIGFFAGRLADRYPAGILCGIGLLAMAGGVSALLLMPSFPSIGDVVWREAIVGLGFGLFQTPNNRMLLSSGPRHRSASAGGMLATARLIGQTSGATMVAVIYEVADERAAQLVLGAAAALALVAAATSFLRRAAPPAMS